jgi:hypothetical protein
MPDRGSVGIENGGNGGVCGARELAETGDRGVKAAMKTR